MSLLLQQPRAEEVCDLFGVGFGGGAFHDFSGEEVDEFLVAGFDGGDFLGVFGDDLVDE